MWLFVKRTWIEFEKTEIELFSKVWKLSGIFQVFLICQEISTRNPLKISNALNVNVIFIYKMLHIMIYPVIFAECYHHHVTIGHNSWYLCHVSLMVITYSIYYIIKNVTHDDMSCYPYAPSQSVTYIRLPMPCYTRKLNVDIKNGLNLENLIINNSVDPFTKLCKQRFPLFLRNLLTPVGNFRSL